MFLLIAFVVLFLAVLAAISLLHGYTEYLGNPDPMDWGPAVLVALILAGAGSCLVTLLRVFLHFLFGG